MAYIHPLAVEHHRKRWTRPDAYRFAAPGTPEAKMPGYLHPWAAVARAEEEKAAAEQAERDAFEREILHLRWELKKLKRERELRRFRRKYSPDQPRVPAGNPGGGQWTDGGTSGTNPQAASTSDLARVAQYSFGKLIGKAQIPGRGWMCFYRFDFGTVMVPGLTNLGCQNMITSAGVVHGVLIANDN